MKITRSSKCYFNKWLTQSKMSELKDILKEYARICNYFAETYENEISENRKDKKYFRPIFNGILQMIKLQYFSSTITV